MSDQRVFVITGAAGSGKTTVRNYLTSQFHMTKVITHTTRQPRIHEKNGVDYYFETEDSFGKNHYLESVSYAGNRYGSSFEGLENAWKQSDLITIVLDTAGAITYQRELGDKAVIIFLKVDDSGTLLQRMKSRGDDTTILTERIKSNEYLRDLSLPDELKGKAHVINNNNWELTKQRVDEIVNEYK
ncbi:guanylate kinase [Lentilactobacillus sp. SPB1-3]|uniref:Guanylate kinase n=1 Tax=Lentilactobacillus terminaliae TaxID=3003483 RepID=A0ACD5DFG1_9LACO|nr:AAA family ATPase [Lentilactobacillus sp. SPB1-3]MCZ0976651.1 AAA family ATPase [Lentilactobacillus sp. SPB1-3]